MEEKKEEIREWASDWRTKHALSLHIPDTWETVWLELVSVLAFTYKDSPENLRKAAEGLSELYRKVTS